MKKIILTLFISIVIYSVNAQSVGDQTSAKIAQKMKDSLVLTDIQKDQLRNINMKLTNQKIVVWQQHTQMDSIQKYLQKTENLRDSLYRIVLNNEQYILYRQKKKHLISN